MIKALAATKAKRVAIVLVDSIIETLNRALEKATDYEDRLHAAADVGAAKRLRELIDGEMA